MALLLKTAGHLIIDLGIIVSNVEPSSQTSKYILSVLYPAIHLQRLTQALNQQYDRNNNSSYNEYDSVESGKYNELF